MDIPKDILYTLVKCGYVEAKKKPLLFYKKYDFQRIVFIDFRDNYVSIYGTKNEIEKYNTWDFKRCFLFDLKCFYKVRLPLNCELLEVTVSGKILFRYSGFSEFEDYRYNACESFNLDWYHLGYCLNCGYNLQSDDNYCSDTCLIEHLRKQGLTFICSVCKKEFTISKKHNHHVSYKDNVVIPVCEHCHPKIHHSKDKKYDKFKPDMKRIIKRKYKLVQCTRCHHKGRHPIEDTVPVDFLCSICRNKKIQQNKSKRKRFVDKPIPWRVSQYYKNIRNKYER